MNTKEYVYDNKLSSLSDAELRAYGRELLSRQYAGEELTDIYKSFTCDDPSARGKRKAEAMAAEWADNKEIKKDEEVQMTFGDALEKYIQERSAVLSPSSIRKYKSMQRNCMVPLKEYQLNPDFRSVHPPGQLPVLSIMPVL